jgi:hypothetical protein
VKRSSLTIRQSIRDKGKLWIPARLVIEEDGLTLTSIDGSRMIKPRRLLWREPNKFQVSGVDERTRVQRILLRFKTVEGASQASDLLKDELSVVVEPLPKPPEEIQVELQVLYSLRDMISATIRMGVGLVLLVGLVGSLSNQSIGEIATFIAILFLGYLIVPGLLVLAMMRRKFKTWLRFEPGVVYLKTNLTTISPRSIAWENATTVSVKSRGSKMRLQFLSSVDAVRAVQLLKERFPSLEQTSIAY